MKLYVKFLFISLIFLGIVVLTYSLGPTVSFDEVNPQLPKIEIPLDALSDYVQSQEALIEGIKPENETRIIWADSVRKTEYALVYLHGFSASPMEGDPIHKEMAQRYGMNLYLPRLSQHGLEDVDAFKKLTPKSLLHSAKEALAVGQILGEKVILMSCSTGGTLGLYLMAHHPQIYAHIMYSPNIKIYDNKAFLMTKPWGEAILNSIVGKYKYFEFDKEEPENLKNLKTRYWNTQYHTHGLLALQSLIDKTMQNGVFEKISQPYFLGYYYHNEENQDKTVSVKSMLQCSEITKTPDSLKTLVAFPQAGDHVIHSPLTSKSVEKVRRETQKFIEKILKISPLTYASDTLTRK